MSEMSVQEYNETLQRVRDRFKYHGEYQTKAEIEKLLFEEFDEVEEWSEQVYNDGYEEGQRNCECPNRSLAITKLKQVIKELGGDDD